VITYPTRYGTYEIGAGGIAAISDKG